MLYCNNFYIIYSIIYIHRFQILSLYIYIFVVFWKGSKILVGINQSWNWVRQSCLFRGAQDDKHLFSEWLFGASRITCPSEVVDMFWGPKMLGNGPTEVWILDLLRPIVIVLTFAEVDVLYSIFWLWRQLKNDMKRPDHFTSCEQKWTPPATSTGHIWLHYIFHIYITLHYIIHTLHQTYIYIYIIYIHRKRDLSHARLICHWLYTKLLSSADQGDLQGFKYVVPAGQAMFFLLEKGAVLVGCLWIMLAGGDFVREIRWRFMMIPEFCLENRLV